MERKLSFGKKDINRMKVTRALHQEELKIIESQHRMATIKSLVSNGISYDPAEIVTWQQQMIEEFQIEEK